MYYIGFPTICEFYCRLYYSIFCIVLTIFCCFPFASCIYTLFLADDGPRVWHCCHNHLYVYIYSKNEGKKGGKDVALLIMKYLKDWEYLDGNTQLNLSIICNNCNGKNKNNIVIQLEPYLIKVGHFQKVSFVFFVVGHTKNYADKRFNNLKYAFNQSNLYTMQQLVETCNRSPYITAVEVNNTVLFKYGKLLDSIYNKFQSGGILKYQMFLFSVKYDDDAPIRCFTSNLPYAEEAIDINFQKTAKNDKRIIVIDGVHNNRRKVVKSLQPEQLYPKAPGMNAQKKFELFTKWRPLLPNKDQDVTCPQPLDEVMAMVKDEINEKKKEKGAKNTKSAPASKQKLPTTKTTTTNMTTKERKT